MAKKYKIILIVSGIVIAMICILPLPRKVRYNVDGILWQDGNTQLAEKTEVLIEGWYLDYLLRRDVFKGGISVSCMEEMGACELQDVTFYQNAQFAGKTATLTVYNPSSNQMEHLGELTISGVFDRLLIKTNGQLISAPAGNREEALALAAEITNEDFQYQ